MVRERVEALAQQTDFLLKKQEELLVALDSVFDSLFFFIDENIKSFAKSDQDAKDLKIIRDYIANHRKKSDEQLKDDIDFLKEQIGAINQVKDIKDDTKVEEFLNMMIDEDEKLQEMEVFEKRVDADIVVCKKELEIMFDDIKSSIEEGKIHELCLLLEVIKDQEKQTVEKNQESSSCCSSCKECDVESCQEDEDIFDAFLDKEKK